MGVLFLSLFCYVLLCDHSSFAIILKRKRKLVTLLVLPYRCIVTIIVLWLFLTVPRVGLQYVIVVFSDHTHLLLEQRQNTALLNVVFAFTCMSLFVCCLFLIEIQACRSILSTVYHRNRK